MPAWIYRLVDLVANVFRTDGYLAAGCVAMAAGAAAALVGAVGWHPNPYSISSTAAATLLMASCSLLMAHRDPVDPCDRRALATRKMLGGGIVFAATALVAVAISAFYHSVQPDMLWMVVGGILVGTVAIGALHFLVISLWRQRT